MNYIVNLMARYVWKEKVYLNEDAASDFTRLVKPLYTQIIDYQATLLVHMYRNPPRRWVKNVFKAGDWENRIKRIKELDFECEQLTGDIDIGRAQQWREDERQWQQGLLRQHRNEKEKENLRKLYSNYESGKNANPMRVAGTCEWFLGHPDFLAWRQSQCSGLLWLSGDPGCGKSVLSKHLVDCKGEVLSLNPGISTICYFFFKDGDNDRMYGAKAICALLHQIFLQQPSLYEYAEKHFQCKNETFLTDIDALWNIFMNATGESERETICVLDALDEFQERSREAIITKLVTFYRNVESGICKKPALKFLVTSRPYDNIEKGFKELTDILPTIRLSGEEESESIRHEIDLVIEFKVRELGKRRIIDEKILQTSLSKFQNRTYLWLHLVFDIIEKSLVIKKNEVPKAIDKIPETVDNAYTAILDKSPESEEARKLLHIVLAAARPLNLEEINVAMNIDDECDSKDKLSLWSADECYTIVKNICGLFLSVVDSRVYLIHQTAREFLLHKDPTSSAPHPSLSSRSWKESFNVEESHLILAKICISYLLFSDFQNHDWFPDWDHRKVNRSIMKAPLMEHLKGRNLMEYAAENWPAHFAQGDKFPAPLLANVACKILDPQSYSCGNWIKIHRKMNINLHYHFPKISNLILASYFGFEGVVRLLIANGAAIKSRGERGITALHVAAKNGHKAVVQLLLEAGANVRSKNDGETALHKATIEGHKAIVQLLLEKGADIESRDPLDRTALHMATWEGHKAIVRLLLDRGADIEAKDCDDQTALQVAILEGDEAIVQLLSDRGADIDLAELEDCEATLQLWLDRGTDRDAKTNHGDTALDLAELEDCEGTLHLLKATSASKSASKLLQPPPSNSRLL